MSEVRKLSKMLKEAGYTATSRSAVVLRRFDNSLTMVNFSASNDVAKMVVGKVVRGIVCVVAENGNVTMFGEGGLYGEKS